MCRQSAKRCKAMNSNCMRLEFAQGVWTGLMDDLRRRGRGQRESGAFLLGEIRDTGRFVHTWLPYDELDPGSLAYAYVRLSSDAFTKLWAICADHGLQVVADVHTHPLGPGQSPSDQANPMIGLPGHVAIIVPRFAAGNVRPENVSVNTYLGEKRWQNAFGAAAAELIKISGGS